MKVKSSVAPAFYLGTFFLLVFAGAFLWDFKYQIGSLFLLFLADIFLVTYLRQKKILFLKSNKEKKALIFIIVGILAAADGIYLFFDKEYFLAAALVSVGACCFISFFEKTKNTEKEKF